MCKKHDYCLLNKDSYKKSSIPQRDAFKMEDAIY